MCALLCMDCAVAARWRYLWSLEMAWVRQVRRWRRKGIAFETAARHERPEKKRRGRRFNTLRLRIPASMVELLTWVDESWIAHCRLLSCLLLWLCLLQ